MNSAIRLAASSLAALAITTTASAAVPIAMGTPAPASVAQAKALSHWTLVESMSASKQQACKVSAKAGTIWVIRNRVDARSATARSRATTTVTHNGALTSRRWASGWVAKGNISAVGSVNLPRQPGYALEVTLSGDNAGTGRTISAAGIGRC